MVVKRPELMFGSPRASTATESIALPSEAVRVVGRKKE